MKKIFLSLIFCTLVSQKVQAFTVEHNFAVEIGTFDASITNFSYQISPQEYSVNSTVRTNGLFHTLYPFEANYATTGRIKEDRLETHSYHYDSQSRFNTRSKELIYDEQGTPLYRLSTKNGKQKKTNIKKDKNNLGTTDLQTVFAELAYQYNNVKFCDARLQVFDGKRRFDVIFQDEGKEELTANNTSPFSGMAAKCSMYIDKLSSEGDDLLWKLTSDRPIYFWLLEDEKTKKPFIAKIWVKDTPLGELKALATNITIKD